MAIAKKRIDFFNSEEGLAIRRKLELMAESETYNTASSFSTNVGLYSDNLIPFVDKHMNYLMTHPKVDPEQYCANLQLMSRVRR